MLQAITPTASIIREQNLTTQEENQIILIIMVGITQQDHDLKRRIKK
jgi:hypothetical protein